MYKKKASIESLLHLAADSSKIPGFQDTLSALLAEETVKHQSGELSEDELSFAAGGTADSHDREKDSFT